MAIRILQKKWENSKDSPELADEASEGEESVNED